ncbi:MAG: acyl-CoA dehydrogenase family protein, partial [Bdellovibrionota bacterium]
GRFQVNGEKIKGAWPWVPAEKLDVLVVLKDGKAHVVREGMKFEHAKPCALHAAGSAGVQIDGPLAHSFDHQEGYWRSLARLRVYASSMLVGVAAASLQHAMKYTQERVAFGRPVAHHQGIAFLIADLAARIDGARLSLWRAAWALSQKGDPTEAAAGAYLDAIEIALETGEQGVQLLGGHGYMQDHPVEKWMREARTISQFFGGRDAALDDATDRVFSASADVGFSLPAWAQNGAH